MVDSEYNSYTNDVPLYGNTSFDLLDITTLLPIIWLAVTLPLMLCSSVLLYVRRLHHPIYGRGVRSIQVFTYMCILCTTGQQLGMLLYKSELPCIYRFYLLYITVGTMCIVYSSRCLVLIFRFHIAHKLANLSKIQHQQTPPLYQETHREKGKTSAEKSNSATLSSSNEHQHPHKATAPHNGAAAAVSGIISVSPQTMHQHNDRTKSDKQTHATTPRNNVVIHVINVKPPDDTQRDTSKQLRENPSLRVDIPSSSSSPATPLHDANTVSTHPHIHPPASTSSFGDLCTGESSRYIRHRWLISRRNLLRIQLVLALLYIIPMIGIQCIDMELNYYGAVCWLYAEPIIIIWCTAVLTCIFLLFVVHSIWRFPRDNYGLKWECMYMTLTITSTLVCVAIIQYHFQEPYPYIWGDFPFSVFCFLANIILVWTPIYQSYRIQYWKSPKALLHSRFFFNNNKSIADVCGRTSTSSPYQDIDTLYDVLCVPEGYTSFLSYLQSEFSSENLLFWNDVRKLQEYCHRHTTVYIQALNEYQKRHTLLVSNTNSRNQKGATPLAPRDSHTDSLARNTDTHPPRQLPQYPYPAGISSDAALVALSGDHGKEKPISPSSPPVKPFSSTTAVTRISNNDSPCADGHVHLHNDSDQNAMLQSIDDTMKDVYHIATTTVGQPGWQTRIMIDSVVIPSLTPRAHTEELPKHSSNLFTGVGVDENKDQKRGSESQYHKALRMASMPVISPLTSFHRRAHTGTRLQQQPFGRAKSSSNDSDHTLLVPDTGNHDSSDTQLKRRTITNKMSEVIGVLKSFTSRTETFHTHSFTPIPRDTYADTRSTSRIHIDGEGHGDTREHLHSHSHAHAHSESELRKAQQQYRNAYHEACKEVYRIYRQYIAADAPTSVNISSAIRKRIASQLPTLKDVNAIPAPAQTQTPGTHNTQKQSSFTYGNKRVAAHGTDTYICVMPTYQQLLRDQQYQSKYYADRTNHITETTPQHDIQSSNINTAKGYVHSYNQRRSVVGCSTDMCSHHQKHPVVRVRHNTFMHIPQTHANKSTHTLSHAHSATTATQMPSPRALQAPPLFTNSMSPVSTSRRFDLPASDSITTSASSPTTLFHSCHQHPMHMHFGNEQHNPLHHSKVSLNTATHSNTNSAVGIGKVVSQTHSSINTTSNPNSLMSSHIIHRNQPSDKEEGKTSVATTTPTTTLALTLQNNTPIRRHIVLLQSTDSRSEEVSSNIMGQAQKPNEPSHHHSHNLEPKPSMDGVESIAIANDTAVIPIPASSTPTSTSTHQINSETCTSTVTGVQRASGITPTNLFATSSTALPRQSSGNTPKHTAAAKSSNKVPVAIEAGVPSTSMCISTSGSVRVVDSGKDSPSHHSVPHQQPPRIPRPILKSRCSYTSSTPTEVTSSTIPNVSPTADGSSVASPMKKVKKVHRRLSSAIVQTQSYNDMVEKNGDHDDGNNVNGNVSINTGKPVSGSIKRLRRTKSYGYTSQEVDAINKEAAGDEDGHGLVSPKTATTANRVRSSRMSREKVNDQAVAIVRQSRLTSQLSYDESRALAASLTASGVQLLQTPHQRRPSIALATQSPAIPEINEALVQSPYCTAPRSLQEQMENIQRFTYTSLSQQHQPQQQPIPQPPPPTHSPHHANKSSRTTPTSATFHRVDSMNGGYGSGTGIVAGSEYPSLHGNPPRRRSSRASGIFNVVSNSGTGTAANKRSTPSSYLSVNGYSVDKDRERNSLEKQTNPLTSDHDVNTSSSARTPRASHMDDTYASDTGIRSRSGTHHRNHSNAPSPTHYGVCTNFHHLFLLFSEAELAIYNLMKTDSFNRYCNSSGFQRFATAYQRAAEEYELKETEAQILAEMENREQEINVLKKEAPNDMTHNHKHTRVTPSEKRHTNSDVIGAHGGSVGVQLLTYTNSSIGSGDAVVDFLSNSLSPPISSATTPPPCGGLMNAQQHRASILNTIPLVSPAFMTPQETIDRENGTEIQHESEWC